ncbi:MAG: hypothetical protein ACI9JN_002560 [Bacteroidia bacterium]|jgi:hypothetical protein
MGQNQKKQMHYLSLSKSWPLLVVMGINFVLAQSDPAAAQQPNIALSTNALIADSVYKNEFNKDSISTDSLETKIGQVFRRVKQRVWVEDSYEYVSHLPSKDFEDGWLAIYYSHQYHSNASAWSSLGYSTSSRGLAFQFMSGNQLKREDISLYGGMELGWQFFDHSPVDSIVVNLTNKKLAKTYVVSRTTDLLMRWHYEYSNYRIKPYASIAVGARMMRTQQKVEQLSKDTFYEKSNNHRMSTRSTAIGTFGLGVKYMINPRIQLDVRSEWTLGSNKVEVVDFNNRNLEGLLYEPKRVKQSLNSGQFKVGIALNIAQTSETRTVLFEKGHYEYECLNLVSNRNSNVIGVACNTTNQGRSEDSTLACNTTKLQASSDSFGYKKVVVQSYWVDDYYDYRNVVPGRTLINSSLAVHFVQLNLSNPSEWKSMGYQESIPGVSLQFLSSNKSIKRDWGLYFGGDIGLHVWDKSARDTLFLNSATIDAGYHFDRSMSGDMRLRTIVEFNPLVRLVPYATMAFGVRMFDMNSNVKGILSSTQFESDNQDKVSAVTAAFTTGYGGRVKLTNHIHLDIRQEWSFALRKFTTHPYGEFNDPSRKKKLSLNTNQWTVGLIFAIGSGSREYAKIQEGHQKDVTAELYCNYNLDSTSNVSNSYLSIAEIDSLQPCDSNSNPNIINQGNPTRNDPNPIIRSGSSTTNKPSNQKPNRSSKKEFPGVRKKVPRKITW